MLNEQVLPQNMEDLDFQAFYTKTGEIPIWDHPLLRGYQLLPTPYRPKVKLDQALALVANNQVKEEDMRILKVLGDAICANEEQLRRYLSPIMTRSQVSKRLDTFRKHGLVQRWKVRIADDEDEVVKPPAPFTLGVAGYKLLSHYYNHQSFMEPDRWERLGVPSIQRYVALNEIRCRLVEAKAIAGWKWNVPITKNPTIRSATAVSTIHSPQGELYFYLERAQMSQNYIGYFQDKLHQWRNIFEKTGTLPSYQLNGKLKLVVILSCSTITMAEFIQQELLLESFPFPIWLCVDEVIEEQGMEQAFFQPKKQGIQNIRLDFLAKELNH